MKIVNLYKNRGNTEKLRKKEKFCLKKYRQKRVLKNYL